MNNEPVAWIVDSVITYSDDIAQSLSEESGKPIIPLYTHPVSKAKDRFPNYESICLQCGTTIYKPAFKTLTDEEIDEVLYSMDWAHDPVKFARAILRKAQE
jgi:hypothetical protein